MGLLLLTPTTMGSPGCLFWAFGMGLTFFSGNAFFVGQLGSIFMVWFCSLGELRMGTPMVVPIGFSGGWGGASPFCIYCSLLTSIGVSCSKAWPP